MPEKWLPDKSLSERLVVEKMNFRDFPGNGRIREHSEIFEKRGGFDGILMDLGVSSHQLDMPRSGVFPFRERSSIGYADGFRSRMG